MRLAHHRCQPVGMAPSGAGWLACASSGSSRTGSCTQPAPLSNMACPARPETQCTHLPNNVLGAHSHTMPAFSQTHQP